MLRLPPGMTRLTIGANPNPGLITAQMWEFAAYVVSLEPGDFENAGIYADKSGYHNTVTRNLNRWPGEYSTRLSGDLLGVRDKARALDVKSRQAASGASPVLMAKYGARMRAAAKTHDPRVRHWREVLGQFDTDNAPEAIDFQSLGERQPDDTHEWHIHWSILAMHVALAEAYEGMLSVLYGESLVDWNQRGDEMSGFGFTDKLTGDAAAWRLDALAKGSPTVLGGPAKGEAMSAVADLHALATSVSAVAADAKAGRIAIEAMATAINASGGNVDVARVLAHMDEIALSEVKRDEAAAARLVMLQKENAELRKRLAEALGG